MKKRKKLMAASSLLVVVVAALALFVWHSLSLYCGAVLAGYVVLTLQTVLLKHSTHIKYYYIEQFIRDKGNFYSFIAICYGAVGVENMLLSLFMQGSVETRVQFIAFNIIVAHIFLIFALWICEGKDWKFWLAKALFG